jgi:hypothetical protein
MKVRLSQPLSDLLLSKTANCRYPPAEADGRLIIPVGGLREPSLIHWSRIKTTCPNSILGHPYLILPLSQMVILLCCQSTGIPQYLPSNPNFRLSS